MPLNLGPLNSCALNASPGAVAPLNLSDPKAQILVIPARRWLLQVPLEAIQILTIPAKRWLLKV